MEELKSKLGEMGFREVRQNETVAESYLNKPQEAILRHDRLWDYKWKLIKGVAIDLPSNYLSWSSYEVFVRAPPDGEPKLVEVAPLLLSNDPRPLHVFIRKDLDYIIVSFSGTPEKCYGRESAVEGVRVLLIRQGKVVKEWRFTRGACEPPEVIDEFLGKVVEEAGELLGS